MSTQDFPKRILMTADTVGGVWTYAIELCRALGEHGIEIGLATTGASLSRAQRFEARLLPNVEVFESSYKLEWMDNPWDDVDCTGEWLLGLEHKFRPDLIHLNDFSHGALPWRAPKIVVGHSCVLSWWRAVKGSDAPAEWQTYREMVTNGLQMADFIVAPSHAMLAALNEHYGPFAGSKVIYNGRTINTTRPRAKHDFILAAGRLWDEAKNISSLSEIAPELPWPVYIAGDDTNPNERSGGSAERRHSSKKFAALCRNAATNYISLGRLPGNELAHWFERASIYALPARYEPFGLSALEAALAGCALVLGDIPSLREIWGDAALFVPPNDSIALKEALGKLISDFELRTAFAAKARRRAAEFTAQKMAQGYLEIYSRVAQASRLPVQHFRNPSHPADEKPALRKGAVACAS